MRTNLAITALIYPMVQAVVFGLIMVPMLIAGAPDRTLPFAIAATFFVAAPFALAIAPRMRSMEWRHQHGDSFMAD